MTTRTCVVLLSGGLDSATVLAIAALRQGLEAHCLSFDYGQRHRVELDCAAAVAEHLGAARHRRIRLDPSVVAGSALTGGGAVPKGRAPAAEDEIPSTYVPARNTLFLAHALAEAERIGADSLWIGANAVDYSGYPDCRPAYLRAFEAMANLATKDAVEGRVRYSAEAPLVDLSKADIIRTGLALGVDYGLTSSCYDPGADGRPCGACDSCGLRAKGFAEAGAADPRAAG